MRERRNVLGQTFGTKKARKAIASVTENAISPDKSARGRTNPSKLDATTSAILANISEATNGMTSREELAQRAEDAKPRPKASKDATNIKDVYTIDSLIGNDILKLVPIRQWQEAIQANKEVFVPSLFAAHRIEKWSTSIEKLKILRYMILVIEVFNACKGSRGVRTLPKRDELKRLLGDIPEAVLESIKRKFTEGPLITKFGVDLMITHLCALACVVENFEVNTFDLKEDLKLENKEMSQYFAEIGARVGVLGERERIKLGLEKAAAAQQKVARLKLPLEFPKLSFGRRK